MARRELADVAFEPNWLSAVGALAGALRALRSEVPPPPYLTALSGHAFQIVLVAGPEGLPRPAPATGPAYRRAVAHYDALAVRATLLEVHRSDQSSVDRALSQIRHSIDRKRPAIAFGLQLPEFGLVRGYDDERRQLLVSTLTTDQYGPLLSLALWPPPGTTTTVPVVLLERAGRFKRDEAERSAIQFAVDEAAATAGEGEVSAGRAAYERWREALLSPDGGLDGRGNAYTIQATLAARREAAQFLDQVAARSAASADQLRDAAEAYRSEVIALSRMASLFPYPHGGDVRNLRTREQGARYLQTALEEERAAIDRLRDALEKWG